MAIMMTRRVVHEHSLSVTGKLAMEKGPENLCWQICLANLAECGGGCYTGNMAKWTTGRAAQAAREPGTEITTDDIPLVVNWAIPGLAQALYGVMADLGNEGMSHPELAILA